MFSVAVPEGATEGSTIQVQSPYGNTLQVQVPAGVQPGQVFQVQDPNGANTVGAPAQMMMGSAGGDIFQGASKVLVKQEMAAVELCGIEAKQRYRISVPDSSNKEGPVFLYITEESDCFERICCSTNRSLKLKVHAGNNKESPVVMEMAKPFSCTGCPIMRPSFTVSGPGGPGDVVGEIEDPCRCCTLDQQVFGGTGKSNLMFTTAGSACQGGMFCPLCCGVNFAVTKGGQPVAEIEKMSMDAEECCLKTNRFMINFNSITDPKEKQMLLASAMLLDLEYFEQKK